MAFGMSPSLSGWSVALDRMHGGGGGEQHAGEDDDAGEQRAPLVGDQAAERGQRRRIARELQKAHQPRQRQQCAVRETAAPAAAAAGPARR